MDKTAITNAAQKFLAKGQIEMAIAEYVKLLGESNEGNIYNIIGDLHLRKHSKDEAIATFTKAADIFRKDGFTLKSIALYKKILNISSTEVNAMVALAELNQEKGLSGNAIESYLSAADIYIRKNQTDKALKLYQKTLEIAPKNINLKLRLSDLYMKIGLGTEAAGLYTDIASLYLKKEQTDKAGEYYQKAIDTAPDNTSAYIGLCQIAEKSNDTKKAFEYIERALSYAPEDREILTQHAMLAIRTGNKDNAKGTLSRLLERDPTDMEAKKLLGTLYLDEGLPEKAWHELMPYIDNALTAEQWDNALEFLDNFKEMEPIAVRHRLVRAYKGKNENDSAVNELRELAKLYEDKEQLNGTLQSYKYILELTPDDEEAKKIAGEIEEKLGLAGPAPSEKEPEIEVITDDSVKEEVEIVPEKGEAISAEDFETKKAEADFYAQYGFKDQAAKLYEILIKISPGNKEIKEKLDALKPETEPRTEPEAEAAPHPEKEAPAETAEESRVFDDSDTKKVFNEFKEGIAKEVDEKDFETHYNLGIAYKEMGILDDAIKEFQISLNDPEKKHRSISMIALCHIGLGNYPEAIEEYRKILSEVSPDNESYLDIAYDLAGTYIKNREHDNALKLLIEINTKDPGFRDVAQQVETVKVTISKAKANPKKDRVSYL